MALNDEQAYDGMPEDGDSGEDGVGAPVALSDEYLDKLVAETWDDDEADGLPEELDGSAPAAKGKHEASGDFDDVFMADEADDQEPPAQSNKLKSIKDMSDEDIRSMNPDQIRAMVNGMQGVMTRGSQEVAEMRRELKAQQEQVNSLLQTLLSAQSGLQAGQSGNAQAKRLTPQDLVTEDGEIDLVKLTEYTRQEALDVVTPLQQRIAETDERTQRAERERVVREIETRFTKLATAVPHFRGSAEVQGAVITFMEKHNLNDPVQAYRALYPRQYADASRRYSAAKNSQKTPRDGASVPPPGRRSGSSKEGLPVSEAERLEAMARAMDKSGELRNMRRPVVRTG